MQPSKTPPLPNISRRGPKGFYNDVIREMRHVTWPSWRETNRLVLVVVTVCIIVALFLWGCLNIYDVIFNRFFGIK